MKSHKYNWILYLITATIITTIAVQLYWNYKNYQENKQRILNEIKISLESSIDDYYTNLSKKNLLTIIEPNNPTEEDKKKKKEIWKTIFKDIVPNRKKTTENREKDSTYSVNISISGIEYRTDNNKDYKKNDSILTNAVLKKANKNYSKNLPKGKKINTVVQLNTDGKTGYRVSKDSAKQIKSIQVFKGEKARDSIKLIKGLKTMFIAIHNDSLAYQNLDSLLSVKLKEKKINIAYSFNHFKDDTLHYNYNPTTKVVKTDSITSKSTYFKDRERLEMFFTNPTKEALQRSSTGILLSLLLSLAVISSLFYLLKIINQQKELAEIKNDLISNITHEFKTPITTVSTALEAIDNFNALNDKEKTKKYVSISSVQLKKLHQMVEKLLETATLDSEKLLLKKESVNLVDLIETTTQKHQLIATDKNISFTSNIDKITATIDVFHFENAISNLIDNAIKYGGNQIEVSIHNVSNQLEISVIDNGNGIEKHQQEKIFDKFYRIPKGNTHDVKGFGIGLYYTKEIIEKHGGSITLIPDSKNTIFKITLPYE